MLALTAPAQATTTWLTDTLRRAGSLSDGRVVAVRPRANPAFNSAITHLDVTYDRDLPNAPAGLVLKLNRDGWGEAEVGLYRLAIAETVPSLVTCYDAAYDPASGASHCLLLDLSATHAPPTTREQVLALEGVPAPDQLDGMVDALADFHGHWWDHPAFGTGALRPPTSFRDAAARATRIAEREAQFRRFADAVGPSVEPAVRRLCERALAGLSVLWADRYGARFARPRDLTLVNGDCYFAQFLCPRDGSAAPTYLLDFQEASVHLPAEDLVFMFATFWTRAQRREGDREMRLIGRYRARLAEQGIVYDLDRLLDDYRVGIVYMLFRTIWDQSVGAAETYWRPKLDCVVASYVDHGCDRLFD